MTGITKTKWGIAILVVLTFIGIYFPRAYRGTVTTVILDKELVSYYKDSVLVEDYLIYVDGEVFQNENDFFYFKTNSSSLFSQLRIGEEYRLTITGWSLPAYATRRNVIAIERVVKKVAGEVKVEVKEKATMDLDSTEFSDLQNSVEEDVFETDSLVQDTSANPILEL